MKTCFDQTQWTAENLAAVLRAAGTPAAPFPDLADRAFWAGVRHGAGQPAAERLIAKGREAACGPIPVLTEALWLDYQTTGARIPYETPQIRRRQMMGQIVLALCLTGDRDLLASLVAVIEAICDEPSWCWPAHAPAGLPDSNYPIVDLSAAMTALELAEVLHLAGTLIAPPLADRIREAIRQRVIAPYLDRDDHWWIAGRPGSPVNNWAAVCNCGVIGSAMMLGVDADLIARLMARGLPSLVKYLKSFDQDGGSAEGPLYWSYGFGYFTAAAHLIEWRTGGAIRLIDDPFVGRIATFPLRSMLRPGHWVTFSDALEEITFMRGHLDYLADRLDKPELTAIPADDLPRDQHAMRVTWMLRDLLWRRERSQLALPLSAHDWFADMGWMISRVEPGTTRGLVVAAKGGDNGEMHNQNDLGSFMLHVGGESLIVDPGRGRYVRGYFGAERYDFLVNRSLGHGVPLINGFEQGQGSEYRARVLAHETGPERDRLVLDIAGAYPQQAGIDRLEREIVVERAPLPGAVRVIDNVVFASERQDFATQLVTFGSVEIGNGRVTVTGRLASLLIHFDPTDVAAEVITVPDVDFDDGPREVRRIVFRRRSHAAAQSISLRIEPR